jgi:multidrug efflux pump subunit AcrA (membrane-fusion protein)
MKNWIIEQFKAQRWTLTFLVVTFLACAIVGWFLIRPAYQNPISRMYTSKLGYATVLRKTGKPFPVTTAVATHRAVESRFLGEGIVQSEPIQVPMIAMSGIKRVHVTEGDWVKKGQRIIELDDERIKLKIAAAKAALETARAEYERVRVGSVNILLDERPELDRIQLESAKKAAEAEESILKRYTQLFDKGSVSNQKLLQQQMKAKEADVRYRKLLLSAEFAEEGKQNSMRIAAATIQEAEMAWLHRKSQLKDYISYAPADGIVERVLVHEGEYNQDPGRPAVILASGTWFQAHLDQTAIGQIKVGNQVEIRLSAFQDRTVFGTVERIKPLVTYSLGGPETNRPIRPLGTGAPEWPATFAVRVQLNEPNPQIVPGLTGFARIVNRRENLCVPRGTVTATSGNRGIVFVVNEDEDGCEPRDVTVGWTDQGWTEIRDGLHDGEQVVVDGYQVLEPNDKIVCQKIETEESEEVVSGGLPESPRALTQHQPR